MDREAVEVIPAVDVLGDEVVRLTRGDFARITVREVDPVAVVERFVEAGARLIHVVDLDGARTGRLRRKLLKRLVEAAAPAEVQASGGIRSVEDAELVLAAGAARVVVGTAAFGSENALGRFAAALAETLVVAIDVEQGRVAVDGWLRRLPLTAAEAAERCAAQGVERILCTAIARDGTLAGPDVDLLARLRQRSGLPLLAAGGIASEADIDAVAAVGCEAAIVGRALLAGQLPLDVLRR